jgi:hypothetical protein
MRLVAATTAGRDSPFERGPVPVGSPFAAGSTTNAFDRQQSIAHPIAVVSPLNT